MTGQRPRLRPITDDDVATVLDLNDRDVELLAPLDAGRLEQLRGWADRVDVIDVGEPGGGGPVAGFVVTFRAGTAYDSENYRWFVERFGDDFYYLDRIVIGAEFRRRGLGRLVYDTLEEVARQVGRMALEVNVDPPNDGSLAFHLGRGYVELGRLGRPGHVVGLMAKDL